MFDGREPIYEQIAEAIRGEILAGLLQEGDQVMSTTQYATTYRINPATAARAFTLLVNEGVVRKQRGVGMFVSDGAQDLLRKRRRETYFADRLDPVLRESRLLGITPREITDHVAALDLDAADTPEGTRS